MLMLIVNKNSPMGALQGLCMGSTRVLDGFYKSSGWVLQEFWMGSTRVLDGLYKGSVWALQGFCMSSTRIR